jgi:hypothetical protein
MTNDPSHAATSPEDIPESSSPATTVREILDEARRVAGSGTRLAARLEELGIGPPDTNRYSESAISNWIRGRTMPPADVLVAASIIAGHPLTRPGAPGDPAAVLHHLADIEGLQQQVDALRAAVIDLYGRLGFPMPALDGQPVERPGRTAATG